MGFDKTIHASSKSVEHYTPARVVDALRVFWPHGIDLDPCSPGPDISPIPARLHYTRAEDGKAQAWRGRVFMNPPYGKSGPDRIDPWIEKVIAEYQARRVSEAVLLVPARTDTRWFDRLNAYPRCEVKGRFVFVGNTNGAGFPSAIFYLGPYNLRFAEVFAPFGRIVWDIRYTTWECVGRALPTLPAVAP